MEVLAAVLVFVLSEAIGLPFCYSGADNMLNGNIAKGLTGFAVGLSFCVLGVAWVFFRDRFQEQFRQFIRQCVSDVRIWAFVLLMLFAWIVLPDVTPDHRLLVKLDENVERLNKEMNYYVSAASSDKRPVQRRCQVSL